MAYLDANHMSQIEAETCRRQKRADFHASHPDYRNPVPTDQWPALLAGLPDPIARAFAPLIVNPPKEGNTP